LNGNALFPFEIHGIHLGADPILAADIVNVLDATGIVQDAFRQGRLATDNDRVSEARALDLGRARIGAASTDSWLLGLTYQYAH
jgi:hypothetical protein